jgi:hypothetical protein
MTPVDYLLLLFVPSAIIYFIWDALQDKKRIARRATREKEQSAALEAAFNTWAKDPSSTNRAKMDKVVRDIYGC